MSPGVVLMTILAPETSIFPQGLLDGELLTAESDRRWWAVYSKSRQEKAIARHLVGMDVPFYLPLVHKTSMIRGRRVKSLLPLFTSYLFIYADEAERIKTLSTNRVVQMFSAPDALEMTNDLKHIQTLIESGAPLTVESCLQPGQRVRVKTGSLRGIEGVITARRGEDRLLVAVNFLQQGVSVLIQDFQVEPL